MALTDIKHGLQWKRVGKLLVVKRSTAANTTFISPTGTLFGQGLDLSELQFRFQVKSSDLETPNTLVVRVYNLDDQTMNAIVNEFDQVSLQAGYEGSGYGIIFNGTIRQIKRGREDNVTTFLEITAADDDDGYNFGFVNTTLPPKTTAVNLLQNLANSMGVDIDKNSLDWVAAAGILYPRGRTQTGLARAHLRELCDTIGARWSIQSGKLVIIPLTTYIPGDPFLLSPQSGLIGVPESTTDGIQARCLLNPNLQIGYPVQLRSDLIVQTTVVTDPNATPGELPKRRQVSYTSQLPYYATTDIPNGVYRVLSLDHSGDTRGQEWYSDIVALGVRQSAPQGNSIPAYP